MTFSLDGFALDSTNGISVASLRPTGRKRMSIERSPTRIPGARIGEDKISALTLRITGDVIGSSGSDLRTKLGALLEVFARSGDLEFAIDSGREALVRVSRNVQYDYRPGSNQTRVEWTTELTAAYPYWRDSLPTQQHEDHTTGSQTLFTLTNDGDAPAHWSCDLTTISAATDVWIEFFNSTSGERLRISGFGLTGAETLVIDTARANVFQGNEAWPDENFGVEVVDGIFWLLEPGANSCGIDTSHTNWDLDFEFYDTYHVG